MFWPSLESPWLDDISSKYTNKWASPTPPQPSTISEEYTITLSAHGIQLIKIGLLIIAVYSFLFMLSIIYSRYWGKKGTQKSQTSQDDYEVLKEVIIHEDEQEDLSVTINPKTKILATLDHL